MTEPHAPHASRSRTGPANDDVSLDELMRLARVATARVRSRARAVGAITAAAFALGVIIALTTPREYSVSTRLLPYRAGVGGGAGLSGLAGLAGIRLPATSGDQTVTVDLYPEVARTVDFQASIANAPLRFSSLDTTLSARVFLRDVAKRPLSSTILAWTIGLPGTLKDLARQNDGESSPALSGRVGPGGPLVYSASELLAFRSVSNRVQVWVDKRNSLVTITGTMPDAYAAADLVHAASQILMQRVMEFDSRKAEEHLAFVTEQLAAARRRYDRAQIELAEFADRNRASVSARAQVDRDRLQREHDLAFELYQQLSRDLEQARLRKSQDTPVFTVLDPVVVPIEPSRPHRVRIVTAFALLGAILGSAYALLSPHPRGRIDGRTRDSGEN